MAVKSILLMGTGVVEWWNPDGRLSVDETKALIAHYGLDVHAIERQLHDVEHQVDLARLQKLAAAAAACGPRNYIGGK